MLDVSVDLPIGPTVHGRPGGPPQDLPMQRVQDHDADALRRTRRARSLGADRGRSAEDRLKTPCCRR